MNSIQVLMLAMWPMMAMSGVFGYKCYLLAKAYFENKRRRQEFSALELVKEETLCKGAHSWDKMKLAMPEVEPVEHLICTKCGLVSGSEYQLNKPGIEVLNNNIRIRREKEIQWQKAMMRKQDLTDLLMNRTVKHYVSNFTGDVNFDSYQLQQFFRTTVLELDSLYSALNKELLDEERRG